MLFVEPYVSYPWIVLPLLMRVTSSHVNCFPVLSILLNGVNGVA